MRRAKALLFCLCLLPLVRMVWRVLQGVEVNPIEFITHSTGTWALVGLMLTLSITPLRRLSGWNKLLQFRRMLGLYAFFYACLHFITYVWLDQFFDWRHILHDIAQRPFILFGFSAFLCLLPLAITSNDAMVRRLKRRWRQLHQLVYPIAILGVVHYWWLVKKDISQPLIYAGILAVLLGIRLVWRWAPRIMSMPRKISEP